MCLRRGIAAEIGSSVGNAGTKFSIRPFPRRSGISKRWSEFVARVSRTAGNAALSLKAATIWDSSSLDPPIWTSDQSSTENECGWSSTISGAT
jgi:hypothetical protein